MKRKPLEIIAFVILFIPLLIYPFIIFANIMSFAGHKSPNTPISTLTILYSFMIITTLYPISYFLSLIVYINKKKPALIFIPFIHLLLSIIFFILWSNTGS